MIWYQSLVVVWFLESSFLFQTHCFQKALSCFRPIVFKKLFLVSAPLFSENSFLFQTHQEEFNSNAALYELYKYVQQYNDDLTMALNEDEFARKNRLNLKLEQVQVAMNGEAYCWYYTVQHINPKKDIHLEQTSFWK